MTDFALPSVLDSVSVAVLAAEGAARDAGLGDDAQMRVSLAVSEAVANAIEHGNASDETKIVHVRIETAAGCLSIGVGDEGAGLAPASIASASLPDDPFDVGGRGLFLIRELTESARVIETPAGATVRMEFRDRPEVA